MAYGAQQQQQQHSIEGLIQQQLPWQPQQNRQQQGQTQLQQQGQSDLQQQYMQHQTFFVDLAS